MIDSPGAVMLKRWMVFGLALTLTARASFAVGGLQPSVSRVIFPESDKEESISLTNHAKNPVLVQAWVDDGDDRLQAAGKKASYFLAPSVFRVDPDDAQVIRIFPTDKSAMPKDRESVAYLNVMYVDPAAKGPDGAQGAVSGGIKLSIRHRIKIFFRPKSLHAVLDRTALPLNVHLVPAGAAGAKAMLEVENPGPFYVSLAGPLKFSSANDSADLTDGMFAPFEKRQIGLPPDSHDAGGWAKVVYRVVNDYGSVDAYEQPWTPR